MTPSHLHVLHAAETIKGGIATYLNDILPLQAQAYGAQNIGLLLPASQVKEIDLPGGVHVHTFDNNLGRLGNSMKLAAAYLRLQSSCTFDIVHTHSTFAGAILRPLVWLSRGRPRSVYCAHGWAWDMPFGRTTKTLVGLTERMLAHLSDRIVCISGSEHEAALRYGLRPDKLVTVRNGVRERPPAPQHIPDLPWLHDDRLRLLFVGRFDQQKGADILVAAAAELQAHVQVVLAGGAVVSQNVLHELPPNVTQVGWVNQAQLQDLFAQADVLVMPSRWEGFGLTAVEAMRGGLPVIASRVGGLQEIVQEGVTGHLIQPDSVPALKAVLQSIDRPSLRSMSTHARARARRDFSVERVARQLAEVYSDGR